MTKGKWEVRSYKLGVRSFKFGVRDTAKVLVLALISDKWCCDILNSGEVRLIIWVKNYKENILNNNSILNFEFDFVLTIFVKRIVSRIEM
jgi:hypothetical protein